MKPLLWPILGAVRFCLALIVAGSHLYWFAPGTRLEPVFDGMAGFVAVLGFLVISGYSISASLAQQPAGFYRRRLLRIMPLYVLSIAAAYFCVRVFGDSVRSAGGVIFVPPSGREIAENLFFLQGFTAPSLKTNTVVWTLSVEVFFYVIAPGLARLSQPGLIAICVASLALFLVALPFHLPNFPSLQHGAAVALLGWPWLAGFIAFRHRNPLIAALALLAISLVALDHYAGFLQLRWSLPMIVVALAIGLGPRVKGPPAIGSGCTLLGNASYPLYLFHLPLYIALCGFGLHLPAVAYLGAAVGLGIALDRLVDLPLKHVIRRVGRLPEA
jgi:peptidoglycan/LPS O-acetylase OafA/YrhL